MSFLSIYGAYKTWKGGSQATNCRRTLKPDRLLAHKPEWLTLQRAKQTYEPLTCSTSIISVQSTKEATNSDKRTQSNFNWFNFGYSHAMVTLCSPSTGSAQPDGASPSDSKWSQHQLFFGSDHANCQFANAALPQLGCSLKNQTLSNLIYIDLPDLIEPRDSHKEN